MAVETMRVVSGALIMGGQVLLGRRLPDKMRPALWEMPGGKIDPGESVNQALAREWREELGVGIKVGEHITTATIELERPIMVHLLEIVECEHISPHKATSHTELGWFDPQYAVQWLPCSPGLYVHFAALKYWMISRGIWAGPR